jgi:8-oxo-dGTP diphosphatase
VQIVVGAALVRDARLLAAQRADPPALAGRWELPGGKVEPGEDEVSALVRECEEELGVRIAVGERVGGDLPLVTGAVLRVYAGTIVSGEVLAHEHLELRWLAAGELDSVDWLDGDRPLLPALAALLAR